MRRLTFMLAAMMLFFAGCSKEEGGSGNEPDTPQNPTPTESKIEIAEADKTINFTSDAGERSISFTASDTWTAAMINNRADEWCSVSPTTGNAGFSSIKIAVAANNTPDERSASVQIKSGSATVTIVVTQKQQDALTVTQSRFDIGAAGGDITVVVAANVNVQYSIDSAASSWIHPAQGSRAMTTSQFAFTIDPNTTSDKREGAITIYGNGLSETVMVYQAKGEGSGGGNTDPDDPNNPGGGDEPEQPESPMIIVSTDNVRLTSAAQSFSVEVSYNIDVDYEISNSWLSHADTRAMSTNTYIFNATENDEVTERTATITFTNKESGLSLTVQVTQQGSSPTLVVSDAKVELSAAAQSFEVKVSHNTGFSCKLPSEYWIEFIGTRAMQTDTFMFAVAENDDAQPRSTTIVFHDDMSGLSETVEVTQAGAAPSVVVSWKEINITHYEQWLTVEVKHNVDVEWSISDDAPWLTHPETRGSRTSWLSFFATENYDTEPRTGTITFTDVNSGISDKVTVTQSGGEPVMVVSPTEVTMTAEGGTCEVRVQTNVDYLVNILGEGESWISVVGTRAMRDDTITFQISPNEGMERSAVVELYAENGTCAQSIVFIQQENTDEHCIELVYNIDTLADPVYLYGSKNNRVMFEGSNFRITRVVYDGQEYAEDYLRNTYWFDRRGDVVVQVYYTGIMTYINEFSNSRLKSIDIPKTVETFANYIFGNCKELKSIELPESFTNIPRSAFAGCGLEHIKLPQVINSWGDYSFSRCESLQEIEIPEGVTVIPGDTFSGCISLSEVKLPQTLTLIGSSAFSGCTSLKTIEIPNNVTEIGWAAFSKCTSLKTIEIPDNVTTIGGLFAGSGLESIRLGRNIETLGSNCFEDCPLKEIEFDPDIQLTTISSGCFSYCTLKTITIPKSVESIAYRAFSRCEQLESVYFAEGSKLKTIDSEAFASCIGLSKVELPDQLENIGSYIFQNTPALTSITIPSSVRTIDSFAFYQSGLKSIDIPDSVRKIADKAFYECVSLEEVSLGSNIHSIGVNAFGRCPKIKRFSSRATDYEVTDDGRCLVGYDGILNAFAANGATGHYEVSRATKNYNITGIGEGAFECASVSAVTLPETINIIKQLAFRRANYADGEIFENKIESIYFKSTTPPTLEWYTDVLMGGMMVGDTYNPLPRGCTLYVPQSSLDQYIKEWRIEGVNFPQTIKGYNL